LSAAVGSGAPAAQPASSVVARDSSRRIDRMPRD
jgi:hypothetical protein